jgi:hypothetical protein
MIDDLKFEVCEIAEMTIFKSHVLDFRLLLFSIKAAKI